MKEKTVKDVGLKKKRIQGFQVIEDECIWMKAGIVNFRLCDNAYDCYNCPFDRGMMKAMNLEPPGRTKKSSRAGFNICKRGIMAHHVRAGTP